MCDIQTVLSACVKKVTVLLCTLLNLQFFCHVSMHIKSCRRTLIAENSGEAKVRGVGVNKEQGVRDRWLQRHGAPECRRLFGLE